MRILVVADLHGNVDYTNKVLEIYRKGKYEKLYVLGDILVDSILLLNPIHKQIFAVKGNCDSSYEEDNALFPLPYLNYDYIDGKLVVMTHGHYYDSLNYDKPYDIFLQGHTHISRINRTRTGAIIANPGSVSRPNDGHHSVMSIIDGTMTVFDIDTNAVIWQTQI